MWAQFINFVHSGLCVYVCMCGVSRYDYMHSSCTLAQALNENPSTLQKDCILQQLFRELSYNIQTYFPLMWQ